MFSKWYLDMLKILEQPKLNLWQWADKYRILTKETSAEAGNWNTSRTPYMYEPMEMIGNKTTERVIIKSSAQVGKSELILNASAYIMHLDPRAFIIIQPTINMAESFSEERLAPMINSTPCLKGKVAEVKSRDKANTKLKKTFEGGFVVLIGANAPADLASRPVGVIFADEIDRYPISAGKEGDPLNLALKRATTFYDRKIILVSTPTNKGESRIAQLYDEGSKGEWTLPCPECGEYNPLEFDNFDLKTCEILCIYCGCFSNEFKWKKNLKNGKWIHEYPDRSSKSYHLNAFTSPWVSWRSIAEEYLLAKKNGEEQLKVFVNTTLGLEFESSGDVGDPKKLYDLREDYDKIPIQVEYLTCGVDTQDNRLEYEIKGWGENNENWGIQKGVILGTPSNNSVWDELEKALSFTYEREDGENLKVAMTFVDSGGHYTRDVYQNCARILRKGINIFPIKGVGQDGKDVITKMTPLPEHRTTLVMVGVNTCKEKILSMSNPESEYFRVHYPISSKKGYNLEYFNQLFAEKKVERKVNGQFTYVWESIRKRNEALDCFVYAYAAYIALTMVSNANKNKKETVVRKTETRKRDIYHNN